MNLFGGAQWAKDFLILLAKSENDQQSLSMNSIQRIRSTSLKEWACRGNEDKDPSWALNTGNNGKYAKNNTIFLCS